MCIVCFACLVLCIVCMQISVHVYCVEICRCAFLSLSPHQCVFYFGSDEADDAASTGPSTGSTTSSRQRSNRDKKVRAVSAHYTCVWYICAAKMHYAHYMLTQSFIRKLSSRTCSTVLLARTQVFLSSGLGSLDVSLDELNFCLEWDEKSPVWVSNACFCVVCTVCTVCT